MGPTMSVYCAGSVPGSVVSLSVRTLTRNCAQPTVFGSEVVRRKLVSTKIRGTSTESCLRSYYIRVAPYSSSSVLITAPCMGLIHSVSCVLYGGARPCGMYAAVSKLTIN